MDFLHSDGGNGPRGSAVTRKPGSGDYMTAADSDGEAPWIYQMFQCALPKTLCGLHLSPCRAGGLLVVLTAAVEIEGMREKKRGRESTDRYGILR